MNILAETRDVVQEYPGVKALKGVSLQVRAGQILGLVGENGAGKSTLIRLLGGIERPVRGDVLVRGERVDFRNSAESQNAGVSVVSQEFRLVPQLSIAENVFLGHERASFGVVSRSQTLEHTGSLLRALGLDLDPNRLVSSLTVGDRQLVEIGRALSREFDILIMDEPTATLNGSEIKRLHEIVLRIAAQGKGVLYVSHHLDEIFDVCHEVAVLRDGSLVHHGATADLTEDELVEHMLGQSLRGMEAAASQHHTEGTPRLTVKDLQIVGYDLPFSFQVRQGEILGLSGLVGSGRSEITRALFGDITSAGEVFVDEKRASTSSSRRAIRDGIFMLSDDRKSEGILPHLDVTENAMASRQRRNLSGLEKYFPIRRAESQIFQRLKEKLKIRVPHGRQLIGNLSGGNQQKVLLGRALQSGCKVLLLNEPTRGVDVGAKVEIYELIAELAEQGVAVVISTSDAAELVAVADRCLVYFSGRQTAELVGDAITEDNIVGASIGQKVNAL